MQVLGSNNSIPGGDMRVPGGDNAGPRTEDMEKGADARTLSAEIFEICRNFLNGGRILSLILRDYLHIAKEVK